ncbi:hypothetical protein SK128_001370, partial [Halocaridina rubra]
CYRDSILFSVLLEGPLSPDDPRLLAYVKESMLLAPGSGMYELKMDVPENRAYNNYLSHLGFPVLKKLIKTIFDDQPPGFFIEAGALDGEYLSNTLYLEREKAWKGLLIEPDSKMFSFLLKKNRRAWSSNCCLAKDLYPKKEMLMTLSNTRYSSYGFGYRAMNTLASSPYAAMSSAVAHADYVPVQCFPLQSLLLALDVTHVDFISLDVEGLEEDIVEKFLEYSYGIEVDVWLVEHKNSHSNVEETDYVFINRFTSRGYSLYTITQDFSPYNYIFIRNSSKAPLPSQETFGI